MVIHDMNIEAYLNRINYDGPSDLKPNLETLRRLQMCHASTIPFENLDVVLGVPIKLELSHVQHKLINANRGGYCFEQNGFMLKVLETLGYEVIGLSARVIFSAASPELAARTHLFSKVMLDGTPWLVDVGVGGFTPTEPLRMDTDEPQETLHDTRRIIQSDDPTADGFDHWFHQVLIGNEWKNIYEFTNEQMLDIDREVGNWWTSASPKSTFKDKIMTALASPDGSRHSLSTNDYYHRKHGETIEHLQIETTQQMLKILEDRFCIELPADTVFGIAGL